MSDIKISTFLQMSLIAGPLAPMSATDIPPTTITSPSSRRMEYQLAPTPRLQPMGTYVGQLQERWQFPSDHLPIGMELDGFNFVSWNVFDAKYMNWLTMTDHNSMGLNRSLIVEEHVYLENSKLTLRDRHVVDLILKMIDHPTHPKHLMAIQECSAPFLEELKERLPPHFAIVSNWGEALLVDQRHFEIVSHEGIDHIYSNDPQRSIQGVTLRHKQNGETYRIFNVHLPGDPTQPGRLECAQYLAKTFDPNVTTIVMGDMNFNEVEMSDAIREAFPSPSLVLYAPYCTNISPGTFISKSIDHFIVDSSKKVALHSPEEVLEGLTPIVELLSGQK